MARFLRPAAARTGPPGSGNGERARHEIPAIPRHDRDLDRGHVRLNGKLVALPAERQGGPGADVRRYAGDPVAVTVRPLDGAASDGRPFDAELVLQRADAAHELGYHGYAECDRRGA